MSQSWETVACLSRAQVWQPAAGCKWHIDSKRFQRKYSSYSLQKNFFFNFFKFFNRTYPTPSLVHHLPLSPSMPTRARSLAWRSISQAVWQLQPLVKEHSSACLTRRPETSWWSCAEELTRPPSTGMHSSSDGYVKVKVLVRRSNSIRNPSHHICPASVPNQHFDHPLCSFCSDKQKG